MMAKTELRTPSVWQEWKSARARQFPGEGRIETFLDRLGSVRRRENTRKPSRAYRGRPGMRKLFRPVHPWLRWPAVRLLHIMGWWHYRIQHDACREGSRICWQPDHWRDGKLGPLAAELDRQLREHEKSDDEAV